MSVCWCGRRGQQNARVVADRVVREGDTVLVADTGGAGDVVVCSTGPIAAAATWAGGSAPISWPWIRPSWI
jgi:hypothetical protein